MTAEHDEEDAAEDAAAADDGFENLAWVLDGVLRSLRENDKAKNGPFVKEKLTQVAAQFDAPDSDSPYRAAIWLLDLMDSVIDQAYAIGKQDGHMVSLRHLRKRLDDLNLHTSTLNEFKFSETVFTELRHLCLDLPPTELDVAAQRQIIDRLADLVDEATKTLKPWPDLCEEVVSILNQAAQAVMRFRTHPREQVLDDLDSALARAVKVEIADTEQVDGSRRGFIGKAFGFLAALNLVVTGARNVDWSMEQLGLGSDPAPYELTVTCAPAPLELEAGPQPADAEPEATESADSAEQPVTVSTDTDPTDS